MKKALLFTSILLSPLLLACSNNENSSNINDSSSDTSSSVSDEDEFVTVKWNKGNAVNEDISTSGTFLDIAIKIPLVTDLPYSFGFTYSSGSTKGSEVKVTDNGVASVEIKGDGSFTLTGNKSGEVILYVYGEDGFLHYRNLVTFRRALDQEEMLDFLVNKVDHYESQFMKGMNIFFTSNSTGQITGSDEGTELASPITFSFEFDKETNDEYEYLVTNYDASTSGSTLVLANINVSKNGYVMHPCTANTVVDFFFPVFEQ